jgi:Ca2+-binding EF-hand superfamily protein
LSIAGKGDPLPPRKLQKIAQFPTKGKGRVTRGIVWNISCMSLAAGKIFPVEMLSTHQGGNMSITALSSQDPASYWEELFKTSNSKKTKQSEDVAVKLFSDLDADGDGKINLKESGLDQQTYDALDTDQDGTVSQEELGKALDLLRSAMLTRIKLGEGEEKTAPPAEESGGSPSVFDALDANRDGIVSAEELAASVERQKDAANSGMNSTSDGIAQKAKDLLSALANRAYGAVAGSRTSEQTINFTT